MKCQLTFMFIKQKSVQNTKILYFQKHFLCLGEFRLGGMIGSKIKWGIKYVVCVLWWNGQTGLKREKAPCTCLKDKAVPVL